MFESPIEATLFKARWAATWDRGHYLSLAGTSPLALLQFLKDRPEIDRVYLCLDNDKAGLDGMAQIEAALQDAPELQGRGFTVERKPPPVEYGKANLRPSTFASYQGYIKTISFPISAMCRCGS